MLCVDGETDLFFPFDEDERLSKDGVGKIRVVSLVIKLRELEIIERASDVDCVRLGL